MVVEGIRRGEGSVLCLEDHRITQLRASRCISANKVRENQQNRSNLEVT